MALLTSSPVSAGMTKPGSPAKTVSYRKSIRHWWYRSTTSPHSFVCIHLLERCLQCLSNSYVTAYAMGQGEGVGAYSRECSLVTYNLPLRNKTAHGKKSKHWFNTCYCLWLGEILEGKFKGQFRLQCLFIEIKWPKVPLKSIKLCQKMKNN